MSNNVQVVVLGAGCAGLTAALQAHQIGKKVVVFEKMPQIGGNSKRASSGMNACETTTQLKNDIIDSADLFYKETFKAGGKLNDPALLSFFASHTNGAIEWLKQFGVELTDLTTLGAMSRPRAHRPKDTSPVGAYLVNKLYDAVKKSNIPVYTDSKAISLKRTSSNEIQVTLNVEEKQYAVNCQSLILATGGFGASKELIKKYAPQYEDYKTTNQEGSTGDGLKLAQQLDAQLIQLDQVQIHPTVQQDNPHVYLIGETVRGEGAILVNTSGRRFVNELDTRKNVSNAIIAQDTKHAFLILDQKVYQRVKALAFYESIGLVEKAEILDELATKIGIDSDNLQSTVTNYNRQIENDSEDEFKRHTGLKEINQGPFYGIHIAPAIHYTMGGIHIDDQCHVLDENGDIVPGLLAAGEVTGGLHGNNRVGGNSIAETIVFGRQAGIYACEHIK